MSAPFIAVVIPCLNEEVTLPATCRSLGFSVEEKTVAGATLILVDNGSTDGTLRFAHDLQDALPKDSVLIFQESECGYVPPRVSGNLVAARHAQKMGIAADEFLIAQADADTHYEPGYLEAMRHEAKFATPGSILEARMEWPPDFVAAHEFYFRVCNQVDTEFEHLLTNRPGDVVLDDKVCAYLLSDYQKWGGHLREWASSREEIHAETTRLFLRSLPFGARRHLCPAALARHSPRRIIAEPSLCLATADFPRGGRFRSEWLSRLRGLSTLDKFAVDAPHIEIRMAVASRRAHIRGLFDLLPLHVGRALGTSNFSMCDSETSNAFRALPHRDPEMLRNNPAIFLEDVFAQIDDWIRQAKNKEPT